MADHDDALDSSTHMRFDPRCAQVLMVEWEDGSLTPYVGPARYGPVGTKLRIVTVHVGVPIHLPSTSRMRPNKFLDALLEDIDKGGS